MIVKLQNVSHINIKFSEEMVYLNAIANLRQCIILIKPLNFDTANIMCLIVLFFFCRFAGILCITIHGVIKGSQYKVGERVTMEKHYGEWNAVYIEDDWRFIDTLWGSCDTKDPGDGQGRFGCDESFFLADPKDLIYTHYSLVARWQLLETPKSLDGFEELACLKNRFFDLGMTVLSHPLCEIQCPEGEVDVLFGLQPKSGPDQKFNCFISFYDKPETRRHLSKGSSMSVPTFVHRLTESSICLKVRFPERGIFKLEIVGKQVGKNCMFKTYDWVSIYKVYVDMPAERGFPVMDPIGWGPGKDIGHIGLAPFNYTSGIIVAKNVLTKVRFKIVDTVKVQNMKFYFKMISTYNNDYNVNTVSDRFEVDLNIMTFFIEAPPFGEYTLKMYARNVRGNVSQDMRREMNVCNYLLISDVQQVETPLGILKERTEYPDDPPDIPPPIIPPLNLPESPVSKANEGGGSIVSTSNVFMETKSTTTSHKRSGSPQKAHEEQKQVFVKAELEPSKTGKKQEFIKVDIEAAKQETKAKGGDSEDTNQRFVTIDSEFQEIPEIPLDVVKPLEKESSKSDKREMKVVSTNKVVPLKRTGGSDDSIKLVPAPEKPKRPGTSKGHGRTRDYDTKFFSAQKQTK